MAQEPGQREPESFPIWFSYCSNEGPLVSNIIDLIQSGQVAQCIESALSIIPHAQRQKYQHIKLVPYSDSLEMRTDSEGNFKRLFRQAGTDSIDSLLRDIGTSHLKVILLSKAYFLKPICMYELCLSLCAKHSRKDILPLLVVVGFDDPGSVFDGEHDFYWQSKQTDEIQTMSLEQALLKVHRELRQDDGETYWREFDLSEGFEQVLTEKLKLWRKCVFETAEAVCAESTDKADSVNLLLNADNCESEDNNPLVTQIYRYSHRFFAKTVFASDNQYLKAVYDNWLTSPGDCPLSEFIKTDKPFRYSDIDNFERASEYLGSLKKYLKDNSKVALQAGSKRVYQLVVIVLLKALNSVGFTLRSIFGSKELPLEIFVEDEQVEFDFYTTQHAAMSFSIAHNFAPRVPKEIEPGELDSRCYPGATAPVSLQPDNSKSDKVIELLLQNLWQNLYPTLKANRFSLDSFRKDKRLRRQLRLRIKDMDEDNQSFVLLRYTEHGEGRGNFVLLQRMEKILNDGLDGWVSIPAVVARHSHPNADHDFTQSGLHQLDITLSTDLSDHFYNTVVDLAELFTAETQ